jgi:hypothetical protein
MLVKNNAQISRFIKITKKFSVSKTMISVAWQLFWKKPSIKIIAIFCKFDKLLIQ